MKRILMIIFRNIWYIPYMFIRLFWYCGHVDEYSEEKKFAVVRKIGSRIVKAGNVELEIHGTENIPAEGGLLICPNHQGMFDVVALVNSFTRPFGVVAKKELANVPLLKQVYILTKSFLIDREDLRQSLTVIQDVTKELKQNRCYLIFPEGTRSKKGNEMQEFKGGSFKAAQKARCSVLPVAIIDSYKVMDTNSVKRVHVQVHYLPPISFEEYNGMKTTELAELTQARIESVIKANVK